ncbi:MAG: tRNA (guanosine(37)-N1)-methyltransferase TrmD [Gammaproteobacteria bacterium]|nr:MAG: tRNA (guanosine(37)-N1)-methyltransferase TrmD [Gammaproteobacteria bacterium]
MRIDVITLFPNMINGLFAEGVSARAIDNGVLSVQTLNPRQFADGVHQSVDDRPYGGGPGMVMNCAVIEQSLASIQQQHGRGYRVYLTPQGRPLNHQMVKQLSHKEHLILLCGRYEGIDERVIEEQIDLECSLGDFVLSGGELAAAAVIDSVARQYPHYTRPESVNGKSVPKVLLSGNHSAIERYRLQQALGNSWLKRPDLFAKKALSEAELCLLNDFLKQYRNRG